MWPRYWAALKVGHYENTLITAPTNTNSDKQSVIKKREAEPKKKSLELRKPFQTLHKTMLTFFFRVGEGHKSQSRANLNRDT